MSKERDGGRERGEGGRERGRERGGRKGGEGQRVKEVGLERVCYILWWYWSAEGCLSQ